MVVATDTSFLFSLYGNDCNSATSLQWIKHNRDGILITSLNQFELANSLRFAECRKALAHGRANLFIAHFEMDLLGGRLIHKPCNLAVILAEATRLSAAHTLTGGHRGFDILHVAAARIMGATHFLTFDSNQQRLASAAGFKLPL
jgi:predicted nucleic acid-binding protein